MIEENMTIKNKSGNIPITTLEFFMSLPDDLILNMIVYDPEGIIIICLALGLELNNINVKKEKSKIFLEN
jgi:hypothetical protein